MRTLLTTLHSKFIHPSLALPCLAAYCGPECGTLLIREFTVHEPKAQVMASLLADEPDVVAFSVYLWNRRETLELADALAVAKPDLRIVLGGPEVSFDGPDLLRKHSGISAVIRGEGEIPLRGLLASWVRGHDPVGVPRLYWQGESGIQEGPDGPLLPDLDAIPSPFRLGLVDLSRGLVYLETSRGCPYSCSFCMSALDRTVRSFSPERIKEDLLFLMQQRIPRVKLVDRTFNYDAARAREIFAFILAHNHTSRFHFEIGAHLLDPDTLSLLEAVPTGLFQFEIGVQSTLPETLAAVDRRSCLERLAENVRRLRQTGNIHLHLDLIAGLPKEDYRDFLQSIDRVMELSPHHLQIEPVKLLPGSPLRYEAGQRGIRFDPHPPYTVLATPDLSFADLEKLRGIGRLLDLTWNTGRFPRFFEELNRQCSSLSAGLEKIADDWQSKGLLRHPLSQRGVFEGIWESVREIFSGEKMDLLRECLGHDFAHSERVVPETAPAFFDTALQPEEARMVREKVREKAAALRGEHVKVQSFAAVFNRLPEGRGRTILLFIYLIRSGEGLQVQELPITAEI
jgi:anaerobic magnesium-protoporphyrin IX monomethyl ester cyclase